MRGPAGRARRAGPGDAMPGSAGGQARSPEPAPRGDQGAARCGRPGRPDGRMRSGGRRQPLTWVGDPIEKFPTSKTGACRPWMTRRLEGRLGWMTRRLEGRLGWMTRRLEGRLGWMTRRLEGRLGWMTRRLEGRLGWMARRLEGRLGWMTRRLEGASDAPGPPGGGTLPDFSDLSMTSRACPVCG